MNEILGKAVALAPKVKAVSQEVLESHIQRDDIVDAFWLSLVSGRPAFYLGGFGIDKTETVRAIAERIAGLEFYDELIPNVGSPEQLLVESTEIEESVDSTGSKCIRVREKLGRAAAAHVVFFDEKYKAQSPNILHAVIDLTKGNKIRHEGRVYETPLLTSLGASNEIPSEEDKLGANWSRETIRVNLSPLERAGKKQLVAARLARQRAGSKIEMQAKLTLAEVETLRQARPFVEVPDEIVEITLDILQELLDDQSADFSWAWADDRRFGRLFDVMQANALLAGRTKVTKVDLSVFKWLLWDEPGQIAVVKAKIAPFTRTALTEAVELVDSLLAPSGTVDAVLNGDRSKGVQALTQCESAEGELKRLKGEAEDDAMTSEIADLITQVQAIKEDVIAVVTTGQPRRRQGGA